MFVKEASKHINRLEEQTFSCGWRFKVQVFLSLIMISAVKSEIAKNVTICLNVDVYFNAKCNLLLLFFRGVVEGEGA